MKTTKTATTAAEPDFLNELAQEDYAQDSERLAEQYTIVQWHRGQKAMKNAGGIAYTGGFAVQPDKAIGDFERLGWGEEEIMLGNDMHNCLVAARVEIAVIRKRFRWEVTDDKPQGYGRVQVLALIKGATDPVVFTFRATTGQEFEKALQNFQTRVIRAGEKMVGKQLPLYAFWMPVQAGPHQQVKAKNGNSSSEVTPPIVALPENVDKEWLSAHYTGKATMETCREIYRATQEWADAWAKGNENADKGDAWACGGALQREFNAVLGRVSGDDETVRAEWIDQVLGYADAASLAHVNAADIKHWIDMMKHEIQTAGRALATAASAKRQAATATAVADDDEGIPF